MTQLDDAILECYTLLYEAATPQADFKTLVATAKTDENGELVIPFNDYELEESKMIHIINDVIKKHKIKKVYRQGFKNTILLGCSPKTKSYY
jgi:hypothetical protein